MKLGLGIMIAGVLLLPRLAQAQATCQGATYEAESMFHSTGGSTPGGWNIWANGYISTNHNFDGGSKVITVVARGQAAAGVAAHMTVSIDGVVKYFYSISPTAWTAYNFNLDATAGTHEIRVDFDNDYNQGGQDRNLYVDKVIVGCGAGGWTNLVLRDGWVRAADSNTPAVGLVDGIVTFRGALDGRGATSSQPFCLTDGHVESGPDYTQYRPTDTGVLTTRVALANGATGSLTLGSVVQPPGAIPDQEQVGSYCMQVSEDAASPDPGPNGALLTSLEGVTFTKSGWAAPVNGVSQNALNMFHLPPNSGHWLSDYPQRGSSDELPDGLGWHVQIINGFVRFLGDARFVSQFDFDPLIATLPANMRPTSPVYLPVVLAPFGSTLAGRIVVQPNGNVEVEGPVELASLGVSLDGASYSVSQASGSAFPLSNGWAAPASGRLVRARLVNGIVRLEGLVVGGSSTRIGQLPVGMRPSQPIYLVANAQLFAQPATLRIDADGNIDVVSPTLVVAQPGIALDSVSFSAAEYQCTGACLSATPIARNQNSGSFNTTGERWFVVSESVNGWQASETTGRTIRVNGVVMTSGQMPLPPAVNGKYYFQFSAGTKNWTSWSFW